ncbi:MAG TPA: hypothetical protein VD736_06590 [Nitrososphaera sp.]|nr:hypothetical protein [Nitrososphaera sp.]
MAKSDYPRSSRYARAHCSEQNMGTPTGTPSEGLIDSFTGFPQLAQ